MNIPVVSAQERRAQVRAHAESIGIDEAYIAMLVDAFYTRIRAHKVLGPIFADVIGDDWDPHLSKMKDFWSSVALNTGRYSGKPVPAHQKLETVQRAHFQTWLGLFRQTLEETAATPQAVEYFMERAERIAESLQIAMFGTPGLPGYRP